MAYIRQSLADSGFGVPILTFTKEGGGSKSYTGVPYAGSGPPSNGQVEVALILDGGVNKACIVTKWAGSLFFFRPDAVGTEASAHGNRTWRISDTQVNACFNNGPPHDYGSYLL